VAASHVGVEMVPVVAGQYVGHRRGVPLVGGGPDPRRIGTSWLGWPPCAQLAGPVAATAGGVAEKGRDCHEWNRSFRVHTRRQVSLTEVTTAERVGRRFGVGDGLRRGGCRCR